MAKAWPACPAVIPGERLSSWLRRIGILYGLSIKELLRLGLGFRDLQTSCLDRSPPKQLLTAISARTGATLEDVNHATLAGMLPFLFDSSFRCDERPSSIGLLNSGLSDGIPWFRKRQRRRVMACRFCFENYPDAALLLPWQIAILQSCPTHGLMLEPAQVDTHSVRWLSHSPEQAPPCVQSLDSRTWTAVTKGRVGAIDAPEWFELLKVIHRQLRKPIDAVTASALLKISKNRFERVEWQQVVAEHCPKILFQKRTQSDPARRWAIVLATAFDLMEKGRMELYGPGVFLLSTRMMRDRAYRAREVAWAQTEVVRWTSQ